MDPDLKNLFTEHGDDLLERWCALVESEVDSMDPETLSGHKNWMSSFLFLIEENLENPQDRKLNEFTVTLVQKGYLSRFGVSDIIKIFQLLRRVVRKIPSGKTITDTALAAFNLFLDPVVVVACKAYEDRIKQSDQKFETLFDNADLLILNIDVSGKVENVNRRGASILGLTPEQIQGNPLTRLIYSEDLNILTRSFGHVLAGNPQIFAIRANFTNGGIRSLDMTMTPVIESGRIISLRAIARDVTEKNELQSRLAESEEKFRSLIENAGDAIFLMAVEDGRILDANSKARKMIEQELEQIRKLSVVELFDKDDETKVIHLLQDTITNGSSVAEELMLLCARGPDIIVDMSSSVIEYGGIKVIQAFILDTTSKRRLDKTLSEQNRRLADYEHEITEYKDKLASTERPTRAWGLVLLMLERLYNDHQTLKDNTTHDGRLQEMKEVIKAAEHILRPLDSGAKPALIDVTRLFWRYMTLFEYIYKERMDFELFTSPVPAVMVDVEGFETVIVSVLNIAVQASMYRKESKVVVHIELRGRLVTIEIHDTGKTLSQMEWERLFDSEFGYMDRDPALLSNARKFLENFGGGMLVRGNPSGGNITTLYVPAQFDPETDVLDYQMVPFDRNGGSEKKEDKPEEPEDQ